MNKNPEGVIPAEIFLSTIICHPFGVSFTFLLFHFYNHATPSGFLCEYYNPIFYNNLIYSRFTELACCNPEGMDDYRDKLPCIFQPRRGDTIILSIQINIFHRVQFQIFGENPSTLL
jgi:hypothetical protein